MSKYKEKLFSEFPPVSTQEWMDKITEDLKGADFEKKLVWRTNEGFKVQPFYRQEDLEGLDTDTKPGEFPYKRGIKASNTWLVRQNISTKDIKEANAKALDILNKGVDSLRFCCCGRLIEGAELEALLDGIYADCIDLNFSTSPELACPQAQALVDYFTKKGYDLSKLTGSINYDPIAYMLKNGIECGLESASKLVETLQPIKKFRGLTVSANLLSDSGAFCYQELGYALAWGNEYMRSLTEAGIPADKVAKKIQFNLGISSNYFMEIAKFRAARMLWAKIVEAYKPQCHCEKKQEDGICRCACKMQINAITSKYNQTLFDPYVNLLRSETEAMSAALAGVNSIRICTWLSMIFLSWTLIRRAVTRPVPQMTAIRKGRRWPRLCSSSKCRNFSRVVASGTCSSRLRMRAVCWHLSRPARFRRQSTPPTPPVMTTPPSVRSHCWVPTSSPTSRRCPMDVHPRPAAAAARHKAILPSPHLTSRA